MRKPTIQELTEYCNNPEQAEMFFNYFESNGWKVGKNHMKNWKSALTNWCKKDYNKPKQTAVEKVYEATEKKQTPVDRLWQRMAETYGHKWVSSFGEKPTLPWINKINNSEPLFLKAGIDEMFIQLPEWPPTLPEFISLCKAGERRLADRQKIKELKEKKVLALEDYREARKQRLNERNKQLPKIEKTISELRAMF